MKKLIGTVAALLLVASAAFAELNIGGGASQVWSPVFSNGEDDLYTGSFCPWGGGRTGSVSFNWISEDEKAGASFAIVYNPWDTAPGISPDGSRIIWVRPIDKIRIGLGHYDNIGGLETNDVATCSWNWHRPGTWANDTIFKKIEHSGAFVEVEPIENLYIAFALPWDNTNPDYSYRMFEGFQAAVTYEIDGIGKIMAEWAGNGASLKDEGTMIDKGEIDVAFKLTAVEGLSLAVGGRIFIYDSDYYGINGKNSIVSTSITPPTPVPTTPKGLFEAYNGLDHNKIVVGLAASYQVTDEFAVQADFGLETHEVQDPSFHVGVGATYAINDKVTACADFRFLKEGEVKLTDGSNEFTYSPDPTISFMVGVEYACSTNGSIGIGFQGITNGGAFNGFTGYGDNFAFTIPIKLSANF